jgi:pyrroline-5-carboxylate reductase
MSNTRLAIIGAGNMAEAIARGVLSRGVMQPGQIVAADVSPERREVFASQLKVRAVERNADAARDADVILLCVKPQTMSAALQDLRGVLRENALIISIAAGISIRYIEQALRGGRRWRIIRSMPNTPMLVGEGMVAMARGANATDDDVAAARQLFESAAAVIELPEAQIDAVTALSGSGPAYFFYLVEQMIAAGEKLGLSAEHAHTLATRTALGAAQMLVATSDSPQELRRKVTSPGGTTQAAIEHMERTGVGGNIAEAILAAACRSRDLGQ